MNTILPDLFDLSSFKVCTSFDSIAAYSKKFFEDFKVCTASLYTFTLLRT